jgi:hypothetical protein
MTMNNPANVGKYPHPLHSTKNPFPIDPLHSNDKLDYNHFNKGEAKFDMENINDLFVNNLPPNQSVNTFLDKNNPNPDFFINSSNNQNFAFDHNILYNFPNINAQPQVNVNPSASDQNAMHQSNRNMMFPQNLHNQGIYEDFLKPSNPADYLYLNQLGLNEKNLLGNNMLAENMGLLGRDNQFMFSGLDQDLGQARQLPFPNQLLLNNFYGSDFNLQNLFLPNMSGFNLEDLYNLQMQGGMTGNNGSGNLGMGSNANFSANFRGNSGSNMQGNLGGMSPSNMHTFGGMNASNAPRNSNGFPNLKVEGNPQQQRMETNIKRLEPNSPANTMKDMMSMNQQTSSNPSMIGKNLPNNMNRMPNSKTPMNFNKTPNYDINMGMTINPPMKNFGPSNNNLSPQSQYARNNMNTGNIGNTTEMSGQQDQTMKVKGENIPQKTMNNWPEASALNVDLTKIMQSSPGSLKNNLMNSIDFENAFGKNLLDPLMLGKSKNGILDPFGMGDDFLMGGQMDVYHRLKEKNKYERSLKIERYKNKKRNWEKKIAYECRRRVANTRLRIKGRFISKKDCEKIWEFVGEQGEAFNDKKNLNLDYITSKFNVDGENEPLVDMPPVKPNISKKFLLNKIDEILSNKKIPLTTKNVTSYKFMGDKVKGLLFSSKKIFKLQTRSGYSRQNFRMDQSSRSQSDDSNKLTQETRNEENLNPGFNFDFQMPLQLNPELGENGVEFNESFMPVHPQEYERILIENGKLANLPKEVVEAMMENMMKIGPNGMGIPAGSFEGQGRFDGQALRATFNSEEML